MAGALLCSGYYYDLDDSYDESDEEEVKAHLRRVTEQPPLKLDTSSEVHTRRRTHTHKLHATSQGAWAHGLSFLIVKPQIKIFCVNLLYVCVYA